TPLPYTTLFRSFFCRLQQRLVVRGQLLNPPMNAPRDDDSGDNGAGGDDEGDRDRSEVFELPYEHRRESPDGGHRNGDQAPELRLNTARHIRDHCKPAARMPRRELERALAQLLKSRAAYGWLCGS